MALYHFKAKVVTRSGGRNIIAAAAYRRAAKMVDKETGEYWDYRHKPNVIYSEMLIPENSFEWLTDIKQLADNPLSYHEGSEKLWNMVESTENRKDSQLAREVVVALMRELSEEQNIKLLREFISDQFVMRGMVADLSVHWDKGNPHAHVLLTMRNIGISGFLEKNRTWNSKAMLEEWRAQWANYVNFHLKLYGHETTVDHRSYANRGIDLVPTVHLGKAVIEMNNRGIKTDRFLESEQIKIENLRRIARNPNSTIIEKVSQEKACFSKNDLGKTLETYLSASKDLMLYKPQASNNNSQESLPTNKTESNRFNINNPTTFTTTSGIDKEVVIHPTTLSNVPNASTPDGLLAHQILTSSTDLLNQINETSPIAPSPVFNVEELLKKIEYHDSVFSEKTIAMLINKEIENPELFTQATVAVLSSTEVLPLGLGDDGRQRYTTKNMFKLENLAINDADSLANIKHIKISKRAINHSIQLHEKSTNKPLTDEQRFAANHILSSRSIACLVAVAGSGKSFTIAALHEVWRSQKIPVFGIALSGVAADGLQRDAGINAATIESFLIQIKNNPNYLPQRSVVVMDEAGMADSVSMQAVLQAVRRSKSKLILVGDPAQLQPVGPGALFRSLAKRHGFVEIQTVYRQKNEWQKMATKDFAAGRVEEGINAYHSHGFVTFANTTRIAQANLVHDWLNSTSPVEQRLVLAHRNDDVYTLNQLIRQELVTTGTLAAGYRVATTKGEISIAKGDRILFLKNNSFIGVKNGRFATITHVELTESGEVLKFNALLDGAEKKTVTIDPSRYRDFSHGYAATVYKAQGVTVDDSFIYADRNWMRDLIYVAMSRHRNYAKLYADKSQVQDIEALIRSFSRASMKDSILDFPKEFAELRGIERGKTEDQTLIQRLKFRLNSLKETIVNNANRIILNSYTNNQAQKTLEFEKNRDIEIENVYARRKDAVVVAAYADARVDFAKHYQLLNVELNRLGFKIDDHVNADIIKNIAHYKVMQDKLIQRDKLAAQIFKTVENYQDILRDYGLKIGEIKKQAVSHHRRDEVVEYMKLVADGKTIFRDRLACKLMQDIKGYFPALKTCGIDNQSLRKYALQHLARQQKISLSKEERYTFDVIEEYRTLNTKIANYIKEQKKQIDNKQIDSLNYTDEFKQLTQRRNKLAHSIVSQSNLYEKALDFYQIGKASSLFGVKDPNEQEQQWATSRWHKLQSYAAINANQERVAAYFSAKENNDLLLSYRLAHEITSLAKDHHGAIINLGLDAKISWKEIRCDAKTYERNQYVDSLQTNQEKAAFTVVEHYIEARRANGSLFHELFAMKEKYNLSQDEFYHVFIPNLHPNHDRHVTRMEYYADLILRDLPAHLRFLQHFKVDLITLNKPAYQEICRNRVKSYINALENASTLARGAIADEITKDFKSHYKHLIKHQIDVASLDRDAKLYQHTTLARQLSKADRKIVRLWQQYKQLNGEIGKTFSRLDDYEPTSRTYKNVRSKGFSSVAKRNALAHELNSLIFVSQWDNATETDITSKLLGYNAKKVEEQAAIYQKLEDKFTIWLSNTEELNLLTQALINSKQSNVLIKQWRTLYAEQKHIINHLNREIKNYRPILKKQNLTIENFQNACKKLEVLHNALDKLNLTASNAIANDTSLQKRIHRAHTIAKQSVAISGTLAERYLREHRGIQGELSTMYRYHAGIYNAVIKKKLPALVVIAENEQHKLRAVQIVFLDPKSANKAELETKKLTFGTLSTEPATVIVNVGKDKKVVFVIEGPETAHSIKEAYPYATIYCTLSSGNFRNIFLTNETKHVIFCADNDGIDSASSKTLAAAAIILSNKYNVNVWKAEPNMIANYKSTDFNDVLQIEGINAIKGSFQQPKLLERANTNTHHQSQRSLKGKLKHLIKGYEANTRQAEIVTSINRSEIIIDVPAYKTKNVEALQRASNKLENLITHYDKANENNLNNLQRSILLKDIERIVRQIKQSPSFYNPLKIENPQLALRIEQFSHGMRIKR